MHMFNWIVRIFRRPVIGSISFGVIFGGVPIGYVLSMLGKNVNSPEYLGYTLYMTPVAILVVAAGTVLLGPAQWRRRVMSALLVSLGAWVPIPLAVMTTLDVRWGNGFRPADFFFLLIFYMVWGVVVATPGWVLALIWARSRSRGKPTAGVER